MRGVGWYCGHPHRRTSLKTTAACLGTCLVLVAPFVHSAEPAKYPLATKTPLFEAAARGNLEAVKKRLAMGDDPNVKVEGGLTPLIIASYGGRVEVVKVLLAAKADPNRVNDDKEPPLITVAASPKADLIVPLLIKAGATLELKDKWGRTPLNVLVQEGRRGAVFHLLDKGARTDVIDADGQSVLFSAALGGNDAILERLLKDPVARKLLDRPNPQGATPLLVAAEKGHKAVVSRLLGAGAKVGATTKEGWTAMGVSVARGHLPVAELLLKAGVKLGAVHGPHGAALHVATATGSVQAVRWLLGKKADANALVGQMRPLHWVILHGNVEVARALVKGGAKVDALSSNNVTALLLAAYTGKLKFAEFLLDKGSDIMKANPQGGTPLRSAADRGHVELVKLLLKRGADKTKRDSFGKLPIDYARENGHKDVVVLLE